MLSYILESIPTNIFCSFNSLNASGSTLLTSNTGKKFGAFLKCRIIILFIVAIFIFCGLKIVNPNESIVFVLFGKYYGTIKKPGFCSN